jgi:hypothetical protein
MKVRIHQDIYQTEDKNRLENRKMISPKLKNSKFQILLG